jgi:hypothetical protein
VTSLVVAAIAVVVAFALVVVASASYCARQQRAQLERQSAAGSRARRDAGARGVRGRGDRPSVRWLHVTVLAEAEFRTRCTVRRVGACRARRRRGRLRRDRHRDGAAPSPDAPWDADAANDSHVTGFYDETATLYVRHRVHAAGRDHRRARVVHANQDRPGLASRVTRARTGDESCCAAGGSRESHGDRARLRKDQPESWRRSVEMADYASSAVPVSDTAGAFPYETARSSCSVKAAGGTAAVRAFSAPPL